MKAFVLSLIVLVAVTLVAAASLKLVPMSSSDINSVNNTVRL